MTNETRTPAAGDDGASASDTVRDGESIVVQDETSDPGRDGAAATRDPAVDAAQDSAGPKAAEEPAPDYSKLVLPEGYATEDPLMAQALDLFGEHRLPAELAQKLVDFAAHRDKAAADAHARAWNGVIRGWQVALRDELVASTEFTGAAHGGDRLKEMQSLVARAIDAYGGRDAAAIREHLKTYALGDHPAFARFLARAGRSVREDGLPRSGEGGGPAGMAQTLYPNQGKE